MCSQMYLGIQGKLMSIEVLHRTENSILWERLSMYTGCAKRAFGEFSFENSRFSCVFSEDWNKLRPDPEHISHQHLPSSTVLTDTSTSSPLAADISCVLAVVAEQSAPLKSCDMCTGQVSALPSCWALSCHCLTGQRMAGSTLSAKPYCC